MAASYIIPALARTFDVIDYISKSSDGASFGDIVKGLDAPKASIFRILHTLESRAWIEKREIGIISTTCLFTMECSPWPGVTWSKLLVHTFRL